MVNPYQPGYPAAPPPGPGWGAPPNYMGAQPVPNGRSVKERKPVDMVAGVALIFAELMVVAQSIWGIIGGYTDYYFPYGNAVFIFMFWVCAIVGTVGAVMLLTGGSVSTRGRTLAAIGAGAIFLRTVPRAFAFYDWFSAGGWLTIPASIVTLIAVGTLIAGKPGSSGSSTGGWPAPDYQAAPGYAGATPVPPGYPMGAPAPAAYRGYSYPQRVAAPGQPMQQAGVAPGASVPQPQSAGWVPQWPSPTFPSPTFPPGSVPPPGASDSVATSGAVPGAPGSPSGMPDFVATQVMGSGAPVAQQRPPESVAAHGMVPGAPGPQPGVPDSAATRVVGPAGSGPQPMSPATPPPPVPVHPGPGGPGQRP